MKNVTIEFCVGTACHMKGAPELLAVLDLMPPEIRSGVQVSFTHCLEKCGDGPNVRIGGVVYSSVTPERLIELVKQQLS